MTLDAFEVEINRNIEAVLDPAEKATSLRKLSLSIRRIAWNASFQAPAREMADRADEEARKIESSHGLHPTGRWPRWPSTYQSSSGWSREIV